MIKCVQFSLSYSSYWKCNFPTNQSVRLSVDWLVGWSVCHNFLKRRKLHFRIKIQGANPSIWIIGLNAACLKKRRTKKSYTLTYIFQLTFANLISLTSMFLLDDDVRINYKVPVHKQIWGDGIGSFGSCIPQGGGDAVRPQFIAKKKIPLFFVLPTSSPI